jgi:hypothetical protein
MFLQQMRGDAVLFAQDTQQQVLSSDPLFTQPLCLLSGECDDPLALARKRKIDSGLSRSGGCPLFCLRIDLEPPQVDFIPIRQRISSTSGALKRLYIVFASTE